MKSKFNSPWIAIVIGLASIGISIFLFIKNDEFIDKAVNVKGVIVDVYIKEPSLTEKNNGDGRERPEYCPIISFVTKKGDTVKFKSIKGSKNFKTYKVGGEIDVMYDPDNPVKARVKMEKKDNKFNAMLSGGFGILIIGIGIFGVIRNRKKTA